MKKHIFLTLLLCIFSCAYSSTTSNQSIIEFKLHIVEQELNNLNQNIAEQKTIMQNEINNQNDFLKNNIDRIDKNIDRWIAILSVFPWIAISISCLENRILCWQIRERGRQM